ncbi:putative late blight resistance protein homolog R1A-10 [Salvia miltiorrhiza]|uniref:putative late blight resistance protein homolog R1A-10 n=1 Tax=Salvia miltiorrhiza TaxID=226208 RepID=UPI0025AC0D53|nr:putative late blight resistance protein homolog R1A-10 [Salvia miltiorrhiza]
MAFVAVISLKDTIRRLLNSPHISVASSTREILEFAHERVESLQEALRTYDDIRNSSRGVMASDARIREEARSLEDAIESDASAQFLSQSQIHGALSLNLHHLTQHIHRFAETANYLEHEYIMELNKPSDKEENVAAAAGVTTLTDSGGNECEMVGLSDQFLQIRKLLIEDVNYQEFNSTFEIDVANFGQILYTIGIDGMPGIENNGSRIMVTARISADFHCIDFHKMRFMDQEESWDLLRKTVFDEQGCPPQLVKAGKKIAENCEGLPLLILTVANQLSQVQKNLEYWNQVAEMRNSVFEDALDELYEVLLPTYHCIPQYMKMNFLYMGAFPRNYLIKGSKFGNLWWAEGFYDLPSFNAVHLLASCNLVVVRLISTITGEAKACTLHCAYRHLTKKEAERNKVFHILNTCGDCSIELVETHRCLAIHQNVLFAVKDVHNTIASVAAVRSVLCMGLYHRYQVPICSDWELLRVLNALSIRFYEFPLNLVNLILLRYLALTCDANLPCSVSNFWNLQYLIIHQHLRIKSMVDSSCLPMEIWDLKELMHLQIMGRNLPDPPIGAILPKLAELLDVGVQSCSTKVLQSVPNLEKLRVQIESAAEYLNWFDHVSCLHQLRSLQSVVVYPDLFPEPIVLPLTLSIPTFSLQKLSLEGFGFSWMEMIKIAKLANLEKLILRCYAFQGEKWDANGIVFSRLWYLCVEDTDVVQWMAGDGTFPRLRRLTMKNCYNIEEIPRFASNDEKVEASSVIVIELVDCNPLAETCAKQWCPCVIANYSWK